MKFNLKLIKKVIKCKRNEIKLKWLKNELNTFSILIKKNYFIYIRSNFEILKEIETIRNILYIFENIRKIFNT